MKLTKTQYKKQLAALNEKLTSVESALALANETFGESLDVIDQWNELHDERDEVRNEIHDLKSAWSTRNWTAGDWNSYALVAANID
jgi:DNA repair exonuclease SbcCD ATPase subunit